MEPVYLYVYNLAESSSFASLPSSGRNNDFLSKARDTGFCTLGLKAWHTSLVMFGMEIAYGMTGITITELESKNPHDVGAIKKILLGHTGLTCEFIRRYVDYLRQNEFTADNYNVLNHNCNVFTSFLCKNLLGKDIPTEYSSAVKNFFKNLVELGLTAFNIVTLFMYLKKLPLKSL